MLLSLATSALQLVLVELREFSEDDSLLFFGQARSTVCDRHTEVTHGIRAELDHGHLKLTRECGSSLVYTYLVSDSGLTTDAGHHTGDAHAHFATSQSELHLRQITASINCEYSEEKRKRRKKGDLPYRVGDEVADDLLDPVDVDVEDQAPLRREKFIGHHIQAALLICEAK